MRTAAITGAAGFLGRHLLHAFASAGWRVIGLCRRPGEHAAAGSVSYAYFDLRNAAEINLDGVDTLIHCAIEPYRRIGNPSASINVTGSSSLFERARSEGVRKIVFISSTASRAETQSEYGLEKFAVENLLDPHRDLTVRPGLVVGDGGLFRAMYQSIRKTRVAPLFLGGEQPVYTVGIAALTAAIVRLVERDCAGTYVLAAPDPVSMRSLYEQIARKANVRVRLIPLPYVPLLRTLEIIERLGVSLPLSSGSMKGVASMQYVTVPIYQDLGVAIEPFPLALDAVHFTTT